jgi:cytoskeletal protein RodZ
MLKTAREEKGLSVNEVGRDTNIASRYIEAMENEDFAAFPGEAYLLGFLRNYGEYLGLDVDSILTAYRARKIQETPIPVDQLLHKKRDYGKIIRTGLGVLAAAAISGGIVAFILTRPAPAPVAEPAPRVLIEHTMDGDVFERRLYSGDSVLIAVENGDQYKIELSTIGETLTIATPSGDIIIDLSDEVSIDLDTDGQTDIRVVAADYLKNDPTQGALLRFERELLPTATVAVDLPVDTMTTAPAATPAITNAPVIFSSPNAYPFTIQAQFQGYCLFRWEILNERDRAGRNERYFQRGDEFQTQAQNGVRIWASNAGAVRMSVIGGGRTVNQDLGGPGEVVVADLRWVRDEDGRYRLILLRLEQ